MWALLLILRRDCLWEQIDSMPTCLLSIIPYLVLTVSFSRSWAHFSLLISPSFSTMWKDTNLHRASVFCGQKNCILSRGDLCCCWAELCVVRKKGVPKTQCLRKSGGVWPHTAVCTVPWDEQDSLRLMEQVEGSHAAPLEHWEQLFQTENWYFVTSVERSCLSCWGSRGSTTLTHGSQGTSPCVGTTTPGALQNKPQSSPWQLQRLFPHLGSARHHQCPCWAPWSSQWHRLRSEGNVTPLFPPSGIPLLNSTAGHRALIWFYR